jgi:hypothetical protein
MHMEGGIRLKLPDETHDPTKLPLDEHEKAGTDMKTRAGAVFSRTEPRDHHSSRLN